ncbi:unnamed protein product, partial [Polarella glacialis]
ELAVVDLGDVRRMLPGPYEQLLLQDWPGGEGLALSSELTKLRALATVEWGNWRLVLDDGPGSWARAAAYLRLWPNKDPVIRGSYRGALRLRWRGGVLHVIQIGSPLLKRARLTTSRKFHGKEFPRHPPLLRAPDVSITVGKVGESCDEACSAIDSTDGARGCREADLLFLNGCGAMRALLGMDACAECSASGVGQEQPSVVLSEAKASEESLAIGSCLWSANLAVPPSCEASHQRMARLCPCRPERPLRNQSVLAASNRGIPRAMEPRGLVDATLPSERCGAAFGNRLAADCAAHKRWCCSAGMWCGNSSSHCVSPESECRGGSSPLRFCGAGWSLRVPEFGLSPPAAR